MTDWTPERVEKMRKMWVDGESGAAIARALGSVSRCAVLSKANRMGLARGKPAAPEAIREAPVVTPSPFRVGRDGARAYPQPPTIPLGDLDVAPKHILSPNAKVWTERGPEECAFPVRGFGHQTVSCCNPVSKGAYCAPHRRTMYDPTPRDPLKAGMAREGSRRRDFVDGMDGIAA